MMIIDDHSEESCPHEVGVVEETVSPRSTLRSPHQASVVWLYLIYSIFSIYFVSMTVGQDRLKMIDIDWRYPETALIFLIVMLGHADMCIYLYTYIVYYIHICYIKITHDASIHNRGREEDAKRQERNHDDHTWRPVDRRSSWSHYCLDLLSCQPPPGTYLSRGSTARRLTCQMQIFKWR